MVDGVDEDLGQDLEYAFGEDFDEAELVEGDEGDPVVCIIQRLLLTKQQEVSQRHSIFRTHCTI